MEDEEISGLILYLIRKVEKNKIIYNFIIRCKNSHNKKIPYLHGKIK